MSGSPRDGILVAIAGIACALVACDKFSPPTIEGEAFIVMKSLDVKKLADLKVYLLKDPYPAIEELKTSFRKQIDKARQAIAACDPQTRVLQTKIDELKGSIANLEVEKAKELNAIDRGVDESLGKLKTELQSLRASKEDLQKQMDLFESQLQPLSKELDGYQRSRAEVESRYPAMIKAAEKGLANATTDLQNFKDESCAAGAKLINDAIISENLRVDLVPKNGIVQKFSFGDRYYGEVFEIRDHAFGRARQPGCLVAPNEKDFVFTQFPNAITSSTTRQSFIELYTAYQSRRKALESAQSMAQAKLHALEEELRLTLQKFDFQNKDQMESLQQKIAPIRAQKDMLQGNLSSCMSDIARKEAMLGKPRAEQIAELRTEVERTYSDKAATAREALTQTEASLKPLLDEVLTKEIIRQKSLAEDKLASIVATKVAATASGNSDGRFTINVPSAGSFVIYAQTSGPGNQRVVWFDRIEVLPHGKTPVKLSNSTALIDVSLVEYLIDELKAQK